MRIHALVLAGGSGDRFAADVPKQFVRLAGEPILLRSVRAIAQAGVDQLIVVTHPSWLDETRTLLDRGGIGKPVTIVPGGATRNESALAGLRALDADDEDIVLVHDAVRPLVPREVILRSIQPILSGAADGTDTVIASADTLVIVDGEAVVDPGSQPIPTGPDTTDFRVRVLRQAYASAVAAGDLTATDDCSLVLRYIPDARIVAVAGDEANLKITTRTDMILADRMIQLRTLAHLTEAPAPESLAQVRLYVIGGTDGIGWEVATQARSLGAQVTVDGRRTGLDIRDYATVEAHLAAATAAMGGIDHVVCSAGVLRTGPTSEMGPADLAEVIAVNVTGSLNVARAAHPYLRDSHGSLTLFASSSFTLGRPNYVAYSSSKAAVVNLVQGLAEEWAADGIRVNAVSPERTNTPMRRRAFPGEEHVTMLQPGVVARATLGLLSSPLSGQVLDVRGGDGTSDAAGDAAATEAPAART